MIKQVIVIRKDLKMRRGKEIAQGAHASMAWLTKRITEVIASQQHPHLIPPEVVLSGPERAWVTGIFAKVVCQVKTEEELRAVYDKAKAAGLEAHLIIDAGRTEFNGVATPTAVGIGPDESEKIDPITGSLELY